MQNEAQQAILNKIYSGEQLTPDEKRLSGKIPLEVMTQISEQRDATGIQPKKQAPAPAPAPAKPAPAPATAPATAQQAPAKKWLFAGVPSGGDKLGGAIKGYAGGVTGSLDAAVQKMNAQAAASAQARAPSDAPITYAKPAGAAEPKDKSYQPAPSGVPYGGGQAVPNAKSANALPKAEKTSDTSASKFFSALPPQIQELLKKGKNRTKAEEAIYQKFMADQAGIAQDKKIVSGAPKGAGGAVTAPQIIKDINAIPKTYGGPPGDAKPWETGTMKEGGGSLTPVKDVISAPVEAAREFFNTPGVAAGSANAEGNRAFQDVIGGTPNSTSDVEKPDVPMGAKDPNARSFESMSAGKLFPGEAVGPAPAVAPKTLASTPAPTTPLNIKTLPAQGYDHDYKKPVIGPKQASYGGGQAIPEAGSAMDLPGSKQASYGGGQPVPRQASAAAIGAAIPEKLRKSMSQEEIVGFITDMMDAVGVGMSAYSGNVRKTRLQQQYEAGITKDITKAQNEAEQLKNIAINEAKVKQDVDTAVGTIQAETDSKLEVLGKEEVVKKALITTQSQEDIKKEIANLDPIAAKKMEIAQKEADIVYNQLVRTLPLELQQQKNLMRAKTENDAYSIITNMPLETKALVEREYAQNKPQIEKAKAVLGEENTLMIARLTAEQAQRTIAEVAIKTGIQEDVLEQIHLQGKYGLGTAAVGAVGTVVSKIIP